MLKLSNKRIIETARLTWGSVGTTVVTSTDVEALLIGEKLISETLEIAAGRIRQAILPIDDLRAEATYRRTVCGNLLLRLAHVVK